MVTQAVPQFSVDPWIYRMVVAVLGLVVLAVVIGGILLQLAVAKDIPHCRARGFPPRRALRSL